MPNGLKQRLVVGSLMLLLTTLNTQSVVSAMTADETANEEVQQRQLIQAIRDIEQAIVGKNWLQAASLFDSAWSQICEGEDPPLTANGGDVQQLRPGQSELLAGGRARLESLFLTSDAALREEYRRQYSGVADQALANAATGSSLAALQTVAARYRFLKAGESAMRSLARMSLERGEFLDATLRLERLRRLSGFSLQSDQGRRLRLQIAMSAWRAGLRIDAISELKSLIEESTADILVGRQTVRLPKVSDEAEQWFVQAVGQPSGKLATAAANAPIQPQWTQINGNYRRTAGQATGPVEMATVWTSSLFEVQDFLFADRMNPALSITREALSNILLRFLEDNSTITPVAVPLVIGDQLIVSTITGLQAFDAATGELRWEASNPDGRLQTAVENILAAQKEAEQQTQPEASVDDLPPGLQIVPGNRNRANRFNSVQFMTQSLAANLLFQKLRTNTAEQLSSNGQTVFAVEDSAWVTWSSDFDQTGSGSARLPANYLRAYDAETGICRWEAGGQRSSQTQANTLSGFYFLGAPLILGSRVYVLAESREGIFLLQLGEPESRSDAGGSGNPRVLHSQLLAVPQFTLQDHPVRKHAGLVPSYAQGLLICPTCDEHVIAISAEDHSVRWAYRYAGSVRLPELGQQVPVLAGAMSSMHSDRVDVAARWTDSLPRIVGDRILYSPRDADELLCLDLQTGRELWRTPRGLARSVAAVTDDVVVVLGNKLVMAVTIQTGELLWTQEIRDGVISGTAAADGRMIHVPTSTPSLVSFEISSGRRLLTRRLKTTEPAGNLLMLNDRLICQSMTTISSFGNGLTDGTSGPPDTSDPPGTSDPPAQPTAATLARKEWIAAQQLLLNGQFDQAINRLDAEVERLNLLAKPSAGTATDSPAADSSDADSSDADPAQAVRNLLVDVLLESLRVDFVGNRQRIPRVRELIRQSSVDKDQALRVLMSMLGMNVNDTAILPERMLDLDQSGQQMDQLFELMVDGLFAMRFAPAEELAAAISELLPELRSPADEVVTAGYLVTQNSQVLAGGIKRVLAARSPEDRLKIEDLLAAQTVKLIQENQPDAAVMLQLIRDCDAAGLNRVARQLMDTLIRTIATDRDPSGSAIATDLTAELLLLRSLFHDAANAPQALTALLDTWKQAGQLAAIRTLLSDLQTTDGDQPEATLKFRSATQNLPDDFPADWLRQNPDLAAPPSDLWNLQPTITASDERSMLPSGQPATDGPQVVIPQFGAPGLFRGWTLFQETASTTIIAVNQDGQRQWTFDADNQISGSGYGQLSDRYMMAYGHLVVLKLFQMVFVLDTSHATPTNPPQLLWSINVDRMDRDTNPGIVRDFVPGWQRVLSYAAQPAGMFPCGPLTAEALPVIVGRRLTVFDAVTGRQKWQLNGIAEDAKILSTDSELLLLSEAAGQIEQRDLTDGQLAGVARLPDWWIDANQNVGSSVRDIEVEPGQEFNWRILVNGRHCVLFRLGFTASALECRDLLTDKIVWKTDLPQDAVFSNVGEDVIAVLCEGKTLKLFRLDTGTELTSCDVTPVPEPRALYLQPRRDRLVILPEAVEDPSLDLDPVSDGLHVYGRIYGIDRKSLQLAWDRPLEHMFLRTLRAFPGPMIPNGPILVLINRYRKFRQDSPAFSSRYAARVLDVTTGDWLNMGPEIDDVGRTLNSHWMKLNPEQRQIVLSFENRYFTLDYGNAE